MWFRYFARPSSILLSLSSALSPSNMLEEQEEVEWMFRLCTGSVVFRRLLILSRDSYSLTVS